jgi:hypothetical protein
MDEGMSRRRIVYRYEKHPEETVHSITPDGIGPEIERKAAPSGN